MNQRFSLLLFILLILCSTSCKKTDKGEEFPTSGPVLQDFPNANLLQGSIYIYNVWGVMSEVNVEGQVISGTDTVNVNSRYVMANIIRSSDTGTITFNNIELFPGINGRGTYYNLASDTALSFSDGERWMVSGFAGVPNISYNNIISFPRYIAAFPQSVADSGILNLHFDPTTCTDADSVYVAFSIKRFGHPIYIYQGHTSAVSGIVKIDLSELVLRDPGTDVTMDVFTYRYVTELFDRKRYAFMKMTEQFSNIQVN